MDGLGDALPPGWTLRAISEIAVINPCTDKREIGDDLPVAFVPMPAVGAGDGRIDVSETRPFAEVKKGYTGFREGDVLFAKITPCMENGKMAVVPAVENGYGFGSTEFHVLRPGTEVTSAYLYYFVSSQQIRADAERHMTGAVGQRRVPAQYFKDCRIPLAPLGQQQRIVAEVEKQFSRLDEAVANLQRVKVNLERYKAAVLKAAVEGKLTQDWRKAHPDVEPASELLDRILAERRAKWEEAELAKMNAKGKAPTNETWKSRYKTPKGPKAEAPSELPPGWTWSSVDQLAEVGTGATPKRSEARYFGGEIPWVTSGAANRPFVDSASEFVTDAALAETNLTVYPAGTLLIAMYGEGRTRGKCTELRIAAATNQALAALLVDDEVQPYLKLFLGMQYEETRKASAGGVQPNLNLSLIRAIRVPLPSAQEQAAIVSELGRQLSLIESADAQVNLNLDRAQRLRQSILAAAFSGRLLDDTSAQEVPPVEQPQIDMVAAPATEYRTSP
ncbi:MAG: restriction endonuclease subunit S [Pseudomonadales bacterium]|jgi:type I restriction enzyme S subunit|nr:restriction endonuclease subunit S [Pseudomonadales bacterium]